MARDDVYDSFLVLFSVWTSPYGYNHQEIGRKVSQLQAVLARRCAAVGELQQHLLRAGWHRGVAQWGGTSILFNECINENFQIKANRTLNRRR